MPFSTTETHAVESDDPGRRDGWEARSLDRSLRAARARSLERIHRIVDAARDLANETGDARFTMAQVATSAGLSLKSVYRAFDGKDDLLLALLEEDSRIGADLLAAQIGAHRSPVHRLLAFVDGIFELLTHAGAVGYAGVLVREHHRLSDDRPDELRSALSPLVDLLRVELDAARVAGVVTTDDPRRAAETVFGVVLNGIAEVTRGRAGAREMARWTWEFCEGGLRGRP